MSCCCTTIFRVCDLVICEDELVLPVPIPGDGEYILELDFLDDVIRKSAMLSSGDNATFSTEGLNERFTYVGRIIDPNGQTLTFVNDGVTYDCIEFTTKRAI